MISVTALQQNNKIIYVGLLSTLTVFLLMDYIPVLAPFSRWVTPPVSLFLGLIFALVCGQAHPKFNKPLIFFLSVILSRLDRIFFMATMVMRICGVMQPVCCCFLFPLYCCYLI